MSDLHRTNINLYSSDVEYLRKHYGFGWTERAREIIHQAVERTKSNKLWLAEMQKAEISRRYIDNTEVPDDE